MLNETHLKQIYKESGINQETTILAGLESATKAEAIQKIGFGGSGIAFPYYDLDGQALGCRIKQDNPSIDEKGKSTKYLTSKDSDAFIYFIKTDIPSLLSEKPLLLVEGEKKCLKLHQEYKGYEYSIASISGCFMFKKSNQPQNELHPILSKIIQNKKHIIICPDSDYFLNENVKIAYNRLAKSLFLLGKKVDLIDLRTKEKDDKIGVDDFLLNHTINEFIDRLKRPYCTFYKVTLDEINNIKNCENRNELIKKLIRSSVFSEVIEREFLLESVRRMSGTRNIATFKNIFVAEKSNFPTELARHKEINWDKEKDSVLDFCNEIGEILEREDNLYFNTSQPPQLVHYDSRTQQFKTLFTLNLFDSFINSKIKYYVKRGMNEKGEMGKEFCAIPKDITSTIFHNIKNFLTLPVLKYVSDTPLYTPHLLNNDLGYNSKHCFLITKQTVVKNKETGRLNDFLNMIPFQDKIQRDNFLAMLFTGIFLKFNFKGAFPALIILARNPSSGKTTLAQCLEYLSEGTNHGTCTMKKDEELEKEIATWIKKSNVVIFDNIRTSELNSPLIEKCLTDPILKFRILRTQEEVAKENSILFIFTMNNGSLTKDLETRCVYVELDNRHLDLSKDEHPLDFVKTYREEIISDLFLIFTNSITCDAHKEIQITSRFPKWEKVIRSILNPNGFNPVLDKDKSSSVVIDRVLKRILNTIIHSEKELRKAEEIVNLEKELFTQKSILDSRSVGRKLTLNLNKKIKFTNDLNETFWIFIRKTNDNRIGSRNSSYEFFIKDSENELDSVINVIDSDLEEFKNKSINNILNIKNEHLENNHDYHDPFLKTNQVSVDPSLFRLNINNISKT